MSAKKHKSNEHEPEIAAEETVPNETENTEQPAAGTVEEATEAAVEAAEPTGEELLTAANERYLRLAAEYDNYRKRSAKEREMLFTDIRAETITQLLPVYDNLARAVTTPCSDEAFLKGVVMTMTQLTEILEGLGVAPIETVGATFDANLHNAVMHIDDPERGEQEITLELQRGFTLGTKVIRHAIVQVAN